MRRLVLAVIFLAATTACWPAMTPEAKCASALELVTYEPDPRWQIRCVDTVLEGDSRSGACACWPGHDPSTFVLRATTAHQDPSWPWSEQRRNLALTLAHEMGHAYLAQHEPDRFYNADGSHNEDYPERFAVAHVRTP